VSRQRRFAIEAVEKLAEYFLLRLVRIVEVALWRLGLRGENGGKGGSFVCSR
jgi:hypothetical protein